MQELGAKAFEVLHSRISGAAGDPDVVLPVQLVVRESCGCARPASDGK
jgi:DNA-binding LacI/PurR family transcriptional regulator